MSSNFTRSISSLSRSGLVDAPSDGQPEKTEQRCSNHTTTGVLSSLSQRSVETRMASSSSSSDSSLWARPPQRLHAGSQKPTTILDLDGADKGRFSTEPLSMTPEEQANSPKAVPKLSRSNLRPNPFRSPDAEPRTKEAFVAALVRLQLKKKV